MALRLDRVERRECWYSITPEEDQALSRFSRMRVVWRSIASVTIAGDGGSCWVVDSITERIVRDEERRAEDVAWACAWALVTGVLTGVLEVSSDSLV